MGDGDGDAAMRAPLMRCVVEELDTAPLRVRVSVSTTPMSHALSALPDQLPGERWVGEGGTRRGRDA